jgi:hypothetical protein
MAATVQGLGVLALLGVALCGAAWFVLNATLGPVSPSRNPSWICINS